MTAGGGGQPANETKPAVFGFLNRIRTWSDVVLGGGAGLGVYLMDDRFNVLTSAPAATAGLVALGGGLAISEVWKRDRAEKAAKESDAEFADGLEKLREDLIRSEKAGDLAN